MNRRNTSEQAEFFRSLAKDEMQKIRESISRNPKLLESYNYSSFGATPLTMACFGNRPALVKTLIELGADPNRRSDWSMGPWSPLHCAIFRRDHELAKLLLAHGAELDVHTAAGLGDCGAVSRLLDADPGRVNERGGDGCQPLHFADSVDVAKLLLARGADINGRCVDHYSTPLQYLCTARLDVARYLISVGAQTDVFTAVACGDEVALETCLKGDPNLLHARINQSFFPPGSEHDVHNILTFTIGQESTLLHAAAKTNRFEKVRPLVARGLSVDVRGGYDSSTPLHIAAWNNAVETAHALLEQGADIEIRSGQLHNNTPAGWAIVAGAGDVFDLLMARGAVQHAWFLDDARAGVAGEFQQISFASMDQRSRILAKVENQTKIS